MTISTCADPTDLQPDYSFNSDDKDDKIGDNEMISRADVNQIKSGLFDFCPVTISTCADPADSVNIDDKDDKSDDIKVNSISDDNKILRHNISSNRGITFR